MREEVSTLSLSYPFKGLDPNTGDPLGWYRGEVSKNYSGMLYDSVQNLNYHGRGLPTYQGSLRPSSNGRDSRLHSIWCTNLVTSFKRRRSITLHSSNHGKEMQTLQIDGSSLATRPELRCPQWFIQLTPVGMIFANSSMNILKGDHIRISDIRLDIRLLPRQHINR
jgi:hypothetical protein